jgi:NADPH-dependent glutamate synthase beta subunit-like oxidoreductase/ferredoxin
MTNATISEHKDFPPCQAACPILTDARGYIQLIAERRFEEAFTSIRNLNPLPGVCGRICTHPCESACKRGQVDEPLAIAALKRFASDGRWAAGYKVTPPEERHGEKVAIVGSGPAGLSAAHDLALLGYGVTIFEALPVLGGMLRVGVPGYRLPKDVLEQEIEAILNLGIEVKKGVRIGQDVKLADLFDQGYSAVFVAIGAHEDRKLEIPGEDTLQSVVSAVSFLNDVNQGERPNVGNKVAVIGGGNTAVDSARSALRLGAQEVHMVYRRSQEAMPAAKEEIEEAILEGIQVAYLTSPVEILGQDGKVSAVKCIRNELGEPDASGRQSPLPIQGSEYTLNADTVIRAIGQIPETSFLSSEPKLTDGGTRIITKDPDALTTPLAGVFAGGDAVTGPATAIRAIAAGKRVASAMDLYLKGKKESLSPATEVGKSPKLPSSLVEETRKFSRCPDSSLRMGTRLENFDEVVSVLPEDVAIREALRCLHCRLGAKVDQDKCVSCLTCVRVCPLSIPQAGKMGEITIDPVSCQACGICALECPVRAIDIDLHSHEDIVKMMEEGVDESPQSESLMVGFFDLHGNFAAEDMERLKKDYPSILPVPVFGLRRIDPLHVLKAFEFGADGVFFAACREKQDPFPETRNKVEQCVMQARAIAGALGLESARIAMYEMPVQGLVDASVIDELIQQIKEMGPNPLQA